jgi:hypothetical protein
MADSAVIEFESNFPFRNRSLTGGCMTYPAEIQKIIDENSAALKTYYGLDSRFSRDVAIFYLYLAQYGLSPVITSAFRSPEKQKELMRRWNAGDPSIVVKPAVNSLHSRTDWMGNPAAAAIDIQTNNPELAARIAEALGIGAGYRFTVPDKVHFYMKGA